MKKVVLLTFALLLGTFVFSQNETKGNKLPSVNIKTLDGEQFNTKEISNPGKPIIISFWALWCKPCKKEMDAYNEVYEDWVEETGVKIYAVSIDDSRSTAKVLPFVRGKDWQFTVLLDPNGDFKRAMNVNMIPHTFLLDGNGNIVYQHTSYYEGLEDEMFELIKKVADGKDISKHK
jgi:thiol-disulfide isomerase/thioredoxin